MSKRGKEDSLDEEELFYSEKGKVSFCKSDLPVVKVPHHHQGTTL
jgi:hypothetical protein